MLKSEKREIKRKKTKVKKQRGGSLAAQKLRHDRSRHYEGSVRKLARR